MNYKKEYFRLLKKYCFYKYMLLIYILAILPSFGYLGIKTYFILLGAVIFIWFFLSSFWELLQRIDEIIQFWGESNYG